MKLSLFAPLLIALAACSSAPKSEPVAAMSDREPADVNPARGALYLNCHAPLVEGEFRVYRNRAAKTYTASMGGDEDFQTNVVSDGPTGLFLTYVQFGKKFFLQVPRAGGDEVPAQIFNDNDRSHAIQNLRCKKFPV